VCLCLCASSRGYRTNAEEINIGKEAVGEVVCIKQVGVKGGVRPHNPDGDEERHHAAHVPHCGQAGVRQLKDDCHKQRVFKLDTWTQRERETCIHTHTDAHTYTGVRGSAVPASHHPEAAVQGRTAPYQFCSAHTPTRTVSGPPSGTGRSACACGYLATWLIAPRTRCRPRRSHAARAACHGTWD
jgi:hypothetical protein